MVKKAGGGEVLGPCSAASMLGDLRQGPWPLFHRPQKDDFEFKDLCVPIRLSIPEPVYFRPTPFLQEHHTSPASQISGFCPLFGSRLFCRTLLYSLLQKLKGQKQR